MKALKIIGFTIAIGAMFFAHAWLRNRMRRRSSLKFTPRKPIGRDRED
jgi:hypothetical protein